MGKSTSDEMILSYNDVVLRRSDLDILSGPYYLNDRVIEFYFSYLSSCYPADDILLVPPSIAFWVQNCPDEESLKAFVEPLKLPAKNLVIFPVNDNEDVTTPEGGSHWSLLAFERTRSVFVHFDSYGNANSRCAKRLYKSIVRFMGSSKSNINYVEYKEAPRQLNGYDCGLFVTAIARVICSCYKNDGGKGKDEFWLCDVREEVTPSSASAMRREILELIQSLMAERQDSISSLGHHLSKILPVELAVTFKS